MMVQTTLDGSDKEQLFPFSREFIKRIKSSQRRRQPEVKERQRQYYQRPEVKEYRKQYRQRPEVKEPTRQYVNNWRKLRWRSNPEYRQKILNRNKTNYHSDPVVRQKILERSRRNHKHYQSNPIYRQKRHDYHINYAAKLKTEVLTHYGNGKLACVNCGYSDIRALTIDHIDNNGCLSRKRGKSWMHKGLNLYGQLKKNGFPSGYQTLCCNCQWIKELDYRKNGGRKKPSLPNLT